MADDPQPNPEMTDSPGIAESIARVAAQYDDLPYQSQPFSRSHPLRLAAIARLCGLSAPAMATARVLELGCAAGGNIIPHAALYPDARFVGIDLGRRQVDDGNARIAELGLNNIEIRCGSITDLGEDIGTFDFIISHGVYSWVPEPVREAILRVTSRHLARDGVAYISFNVAPGWSVYQPLRDAFRLLIPADQSPAERVRMARGLLAMMKAVSPEKGSYGTLLQEASRYLVDQSDDYLFHEYMEEENRPVSITEFIKAAGDHDLVYLADSDFDNLVPENFGPDFARQVRANTNDDQVSIEQMMDVLTGCAFRRALLVPAAKGSQIDRRITAERMEGLHFLTPQGMKLERSGATTKLTTANGRTMTSQEPAVGPAMERLFARYPGTITLADCAAGFTGKDRDMIADALNRLVISGIIDITAEPIVCGKPGNRPRAFELARNDAAAGRNLSVNLRHDRAVLDPVAMVLLPALDGKTDRKALEKVIAEAAIDGRLRFGRDGTVATDPATLRRAAKEILPEALQALAGAALLMP